MKLGLSFAISLALLGSALADFSSPKVNKLRLADNSAACMASCSSQNDSCKRICPATFNGPCFGSCDSQYQTCTQACRQK